MFRDDEASRFGFLHVQPVTPADVLETPLGPVRVFYGTETLVSLAP